MKKAKLSAGERDILNIFKELTKESKFTTLQAMYSQTRGRFTNRQFRKLVAKLFSKKRLTINTENKVIEYGLQRQE